MRLFRWKAIVPLALFLLLIVLGWWLFADALGRRAVVAVGTRVAGAQVDLGAFHIRLLKGSVELDGLAVANASDLTHDAFEADRIVLDIDPAALFEKKVVIDQASLAGLRFGAPRKVPARPVPGADTGTSVLASAKAFAAKVAVPVLRLTPVDTIKALVLDPTQLRSVQAATALAARGDSVQRAVSTAYDSLALPPVIDSSRALADRLAKVNVASAGVAGVQAAVQDARRGLDRIKAAEARVDALQQRVTSGTAALADGARALDAARQQDYAFARGLLKLPTISPADVSAALFGRMATDRFQQAVYWTTTARRYIPPGLLPRKQPGPKRARMAGTTVRFPELGRLPTFLLRHADASFSFGGADARANAFSGLIEGVTSDPALYGKPATFKGGGTLTGGTALTLGVAGLLDHTRATAFDSAAGQVAGFELPGFALPGLPFSARPGKGSASFSFALAGDQLRGRWTVEAPSVQWVPDSAHAQTPVEQVVGKVLRGVGTLRLDAKLGGTLSAPTLELSSNVGDAVAKQVSQLVGEAAKAAEARARAEVDKQVGPKIAEAKARVADVQAKAQQQVADAKAALEAQRKQLESRVQDLTRGALPGGIKF